MIDAKTLAVADQLLLIEGELRRLQMWAEAPPSAEALASQEPFCVDTLTLEEWLQWVFLPRLKWMIETAAPLPARCAIGPMAEESFQGQGAKPAALIALLRDVDELLGTP